LQLTTSSCLLICSQLDVSRLAAHIHGLHSKGLHQSFAGSRDANKPAARCTCMCLALLVK
jgi:hypothetical protein